MVRSKIKPSLKKIHTIIKDTRWSNTLLCNVNRQRNCRRYSTLARLWLLTHLLEQQQLDWSDSTERLWSNFGLKIEIFEWTQVDGIVYFSNTSYIKKSLVPKVRGNLQIYKQLPCEQYTQLPFSSTASLVLLADCSQGLKSVNYDKDLEFHALASPANFHFDVEL